MSDVFETSAMTIWAASEDGDLTRVRQHIENDHVDINIKNAAGQTPLIYASYYGHFEIVKYFCDNGADVNAKYRGNRSSLYAASYYGHLEVVKYLVDHGAELDAKNENGKTALHEASQNGHLEVVKYLVAVGADYRVKTKRGETPLSLAMASKHRDIVQYLKNEAAAVHEVFKKLSAEKKTKLFQVSFGKSSVSSAGTPLYYAGSNIIQGIQPLKDGIFTGNFISVEGPRKIQVQYHAVIKLQKVQRNVNHEAMFLQEISKLSASHGCVLFYGFNISKDYLVLERFGRDLYDYLKRAGQFDKDVHLSIIKHILMALAALHSSGYIHGSIEPSNILIDFDTPEKVKLCDFQNTIQIGSSINYKSGSFKAAWLAPELYFRVKALTLSPLIASSEIDVFSIGLVSAYLMDPTVTSSPFLEDILPFSDISTMKQILSNQDLLNTYIPCTATARFRDVIRKMCCLMPSNRGTVSEALRTFIADSRQCKEMEGFSTLKAQIEFLHQQLNMKIDRIESKLDSHFATISSGLDNIVEHLYIKLLNSRSKDTNFVQDLVDLTANASSSLEQCVTAKDIDELLQKYGANIQQQVDLSLSKLHVVNDESLKLFRAEITNNFQSIGVMLDKNAMEVTELKQTFSLELEHVHDSLQEITAKLDKFHEETVEIGAAIIREIKTNQKDLAAQLLELEQLNSHTSVEQLELTTKIQKLADSITTLQAVGLVEGVSALQAAINENQRMLNTLLTGMYDVPTLVVAFPKISHTLRSSLLHPIRLVMNEFRVFFICSHTLRVVPGGVDGKGFLIRVAKDWVTQVAPVIKFGLILLQIGLSASGIPLPLANLLPNMDGSDALMQLQFLKGCISTIESIVAGRITDLGKEIETSQRRLSVTEYETPFKPTLDSHTAYEAIKRMIPADEIIAHCGLKRIVHSKGVTWIADDPAVEEDFYKHGCVPRAP